MAVWKMGPMRPRRGVIYQEILSDSDLNLKIFLEDVICDSIVSFRASRSQITRVLASSFSKTLGY